MAEVDHDASVVRATRSGRGAKYPLVYLNARRAIAVALRSSYDADMAPMPPVDAEFLVALPSGAATLRGLRENQLPRLRAGLVSASRAGDQTSGIRRWDVVAPGSEGQPDVVLRIHRPDSLAGPLPCIFAIHGGGYVLGTVRGRGSAPGCLVPETRCCRGLGRVSPGAGNSLSGRPRRLLRRASVGVRTQPGASDRRPANGHDGHERGGRLAVAAALRARDLAAEFLPAFQLLSYPMIDDRQLTRSSRWEEVPVWDPASNDFAWRCYFGDLYGSPEVPGYAAPARVADLHGLPPTFSVGTADVVFDETIAFARQLVHCGVPTDLRVHAGAPHGMDRRATSTHLSRNSRREMAAWLACQIGDINVTGAGTRCTPPASLRKGST